MPIPTMCGVIDRRILVNYRVDPSALDRVLPARFRPQRCHGWGVAGICLIRLKNVRPRGFPAAWGVKSENAAHRIAVEWDGPNGPQTGVYIPRRDTSSRINALAGGRIFPGVHSRARFDVVEEGDRFEIALTSLDSATRVAVEAERTDDLPGDSLFTSLEEASQFFADGSIGYSPNRGGQFDGLELSTNSWRVEPLRVGHVESSYFSDPDLFPPGSVEFDCALLMTGIDHEWRSCPCLGP